MDKLTDKEIITSPIFYMGNKKRLIKKGLIEMFPQRISTFVDVFAGSGIVSMNTNADNYIINDVDSNLLKLYNLFKGMSADDIINHINRRIDEYGLARERTKRIYYKDKNKLDKYKKAYITFRNVYNDAPNVLDFYTLMYYSFSQQFRFNSQGKFNMPCGDDCFVSKNGEYIKNGCEFFSQDAVILYSKDFRELLTSVEYVDDMFYYFDPPYFGTTATYNENNGWCEEDEQDLYDALEKLDANKTKWAMSNVINNKGKVNKMLIDWLDKNKFEVYTFDKFTYTACGKGNSETKEVLITNY